MRSLNPDFIDTLKLHKSRSPSKTCLYCGYHHKCGHCPAKSAKCKICHKIGHYARVYINMSKGRKPTKYQSNNQSAGFTRIKKETISVHLVTDKYETNDCETAMDKFEKKYSC